MSIFGLSYEEKKALEDLKTKAYLDGRELERIKQDNEFLRKKYCEIVNGKFEPGHTVSCRLNLLRSDMNTNSQAIKELIEKQNQLGRSVRSLSDRIDIIRDTQESFERRLKKLECANNTVNIVIKTDGDVKVEQ